jgi:putative nucleotidyltransferase with HDIG domain
VLSLLRDRDFSHSLIVWGILVLWYVLFASRFLHGVELKFDHFVSEQAFWFFHETPEEAEKVAIVAIDEASRKDLNLKWPWKRDVTARLVENIAAHSPRVIGLDIMFSGESDEDEALASAFRRHPRIVLAYVVKRDSREIPARMFVDSVSALGFVNKPLRGGVVNRAKTFSAGGDGRTDFSFEIQILREYLDVDEGGLVTSARGVSVGGMTIPSPRGSMHLNYLVHPTAFTVIPASSVLEGTVNPADLRDKIVLVGATDPLIHDVFPTPLGTFPGVAIIGNSLVMLLSGRFLTHVPPWLNVLSVISLGLAVLLMNRRFHFLRNSLFSLPVLGMVIFSLIFLRSRDMQFSGLPILFSGTVAYVVPNLYKYLNLLYLGNRLKNLAITDPLTGLPSARYFLLKLDEQLRSARHDMAFLAFRLADYKRVSLEMDFEALRALSKRFGELVNTHVPRRNKGVFSARLTNDTFGVVVEGMCREEAESVLASFPEISDGLRWEREGGSIQVSAKGILVYIPRELAGAATADGVIHQMEQMFQRLREERIIIQEFRPESHQTRAKDNTYILDFIAYDWDERSKDLERGFRQALEANKRLDRLGWSTLTALARAVDAKSQWTAGHSERVTQLALKIGRALGLGKEELDDLHRAGLLHDIGKIGVPQEIIDKTEILTDEEHRIMSEHPRIGVRILEPIEDFAHIVPLVEQHHEWFNGEGYPHGLAGASIVPGARILAVADVFDALFSSRPYRTELPLENVCEHIREARGCQFDPRVVDAFLAVVASEGDALTRHVSRPAPIS